MSGVNIRGDIVLPSYTIIDQPATNGQILTYNNGNAVFQTASSGSKTVDDVFIANNSVRQVLLRLGLSTIGTTASKILADLEGSQDYILERDHVVTDGTDLYFAINVGSLVYNIYKFTISTGVLSLLRTITVDLRIRKLIINNDILYLGLNNANVAAVSPGSIYQINVSDLTDQNTSPTLLVSINNIGFLGWSGLFSFDGDDKIVFVRANGTIGSTVDSVLYEYTISTSTETALGDIDLDVPTRNAFNDDSHRDIITLETGKYIIPCLRSTNNTDKGIFLVDTTTTDFTFTKITNLNQIPEDVGRLRFYMDAQNLYVTYNSTDRLANAVPLNDLQFSSFTNIVSSINGDTSYILNDIIKVGDILYFSTRNVNTNGTGPGNDGIYAVSIGSGGTPAIPEVSNKCVDWDQVITNADSYFTYDAMTGELTALKAERLYFTIDYSLLTAGTYTGDSHFLGIYIRRPLGTTPETYREFFIAPQDRDTETGIKERIMQTQFEIQIGDIICFREFLDNSENQASNFITTLLPHSQIQIHRLS